MLENVEPVKGGTERDDMDKSTGVSRILNAYGWNKIACIMDKNDIVIMERRYDKSLDE